ncbi:MAG TPA: cobalamin-independent methionine synthase II family protein [Chloroflexota bacterium]|jgi:5-methyltetrahydropteroyltriglutamate--homocysteine methyltransferase
MKTSTTRILTTHAGSLPRPDRLVELNAPKFGGEAVDQEALTACLAQAVTDVVRHQQEAGIDVVGDGEFGKATRQTIDYGAWMSYAYQRLAGFAPVDNAGVATGASSADVKLTTVFERRDRKRFPDFYQELPSGTFSSSSMRPMCTGPISYRGQEAVAADVANLKAALQGVDAEEAFMTAIAPGSFARGQNLYYDTEEAFLFAIGEAMREEYRAIVEAGFVLQLDDPGLPDTWDMADPEPPIDEYRKFAMLRVEALNHALRDLPQDRIRYHICWGSWHGPHTTDLPLEHIVEVLPRVRAGAYSVEAANVRHEHEWRVWQDVKLPEGKVLIPGVVSHATNLIEHPRLVADRIVRFANILGRENVIAGTDCGLGGRVHPKIAWAKLEALAEGAKLASSELWQ